MLHSGCREQSLLCWQLKVSRTGVQKLQQVPAHATQEETAGAATCRTGKSSRRRHVQVQKKQQHVSACSPAA